MFCRQWAVGYNVNLFFPLVVLFMWTLLLIWNNDAYYIIMFEFVFSIRVYYYTALRDGTVVCLYSV